MRFTSYRDYSPQLGLLSGALIWGIIWYPFRLLQSIGISGEIASLLAYGLGLTCLTPWIFRQRPSGWLLGAIALFSGVTNVAYILATNAGPIMLVMLLFYLAPAWTVILAKVLLRESISGYGVIALLGSLSGMLIIFWQPTKWLSGISWKAPFYGLLAGLCFAVTNVLARKGNSYSLIEKSLAVFAGVTFVSLLAILWSGKSSDLLFALETLSMNSLAILALVSLALFAANWGIQYGILYLPANQAILILLFELVVAIIASHWLAGETMRWQDWLGACFIIAAGLMANWTNFISQSKMTRRQVEDSVPTRLDEDDKVSSD